MKFICITFIIIWFNYLNTILCESNPKNCTTDDFETVLLDMFNSTRIVQINSPKIESVFKIVDNDSHIVVPVGLRQCYDTKGIFNRFRYVYDRKFLPSLVVLSVYITQGNSDAMSNEVVSMSIGEDKTNCHRLNESEFLKDFIECHTNSSDHDSNQERSFIMFNCNQNNANDNLTSMDIIDQIDYFTTNSLDFKLSPKLGIIETICDIDIFVVSKSDRCHQKDIEVDYNMQTILVDYVDSDNFRVLKTIGHCPNGSAYVYNILESEFELDHSFSVCLENGHMLQLYD